MGLNKTKIINPLTRIRLLRGLILVLFGIIGVRLWYLQVLYGSFYRDKSENNRIRTVKVVAPRGNILDREGKILVGNRPSFNIGIMLEDVEEPSISIAEVAKISGIDAGLLFDSYSRNKYARRFEPRILVEDLTAEQFARLKANSYLLPGITFDSIPTRTYPQGNLAAQIFGYVREITKPQLKELEKHDYKIGDVIGQTGLEKTYEDILRGYSGYLQLEVDARGVKKQELGKIPSVAGNDIKVSIDIDLQRAAETALGDHSGAVIALDPRSGEVLTIASAPTFDANVFSGELLTKEWEFLTKNPMKPMINRGIASAYPLGSTSKLLWAIAGLSEKLITPTTTLNCPGYFKLGNRRYLCHKRGGHGNIDLKMALTLSCNAFFYNLGNQLGIEKMAKYLDYFGFGKKTGLDIVGEESGIAPSPAWKLKRFNQKWYPGDTIPVSIGQGYFVATPIQLAQMGMLIANSGKHYKLHLLKSWIEKNSGVLVENKPVLKSDVVKEGLIKLETLNLVREMSASVTEHERGTAKSARIPGIRIGGKTGTAQVVKKGLENNHKLNQDHAWFVGYAPVDNPEIVVVAIVEHSGHGGEFAAPVVREVMYKYFDKQGMIDHTLESKDLNKKQQRPSSNDVNINRRDSRRDSDASENIGEEELIEEIADPGQELLTEIFPNGLFDRSSNIGASE